MTNINFKPCRNFEGIQQGRRNIKHFGEDKLMRWAYSPPLGKGLTNLPKFSGNKFSSLNMFRRPCALKDGNVVVVGPSGLISQKIHARLKQPD